MWLMHIQCLGIIWHVGYCLYELVPMCKYADRGDYGKLISLTFTLLQFTANGMAGVTVQVVAAVGYFSVDKL